MRKRLALLLLLAGPAEANMLQGSAGPPPPVVSEVAFDAAGDMANNGGSGAISQPFTVGSGANRILFADALGDVVSGGADDVVPSYNGVAMSLAIKSSSGARWHYLFYLLNPASGSHNVTTAALGHYVGITVSSYANVKQAAPDATAHTFTPAQFGVIAPITTVTDYSWVIQSAYTSVNGSFNGLEAGPGTVERTFDAGHGATALVDTAKTVHPAGTPNIAVVNGVPGQTDLDALSATIVPFGTAYACAAGYSLGANRCGVLLTASGTFALPADAVNGSFRIEANGGSGGAGYSLAANAGAGGCGAYSVVMNQIIAASTSYTIGAGGVSATTAENGGATGGDTSFGSLVVAKGGAGGDIGASPAGGAGGSAAGGVGAIRNSGGHGGPNGAGIGTGSACGAAGPGGAGGNGTFALGPSSGAGGGAADGGQDGFSAGVGGSSRQRIGAGAAGTGSGAGGSGRAGGGAGGGGPSGGIGGAGGFEPIWDYAHGPGGGGGMGGNQPSAANGAAGLYGGGVAARQQGIAPNGAPGAIWITYGVGAGGGAAPLAMQSPNGVIVGF